MFQCSCEDQVHVDCSSVPSFHLGWYCTLSILKKKILHTEVTWHLLWIGGSKKKKNQLTKLTTHGGRVKLGPFLRTISVLPPSFGISRTLARSLCTPLQILLSCSHTWSRFQDEHGIEVPWPPLTSRILSQMMKNFIASWNCMSSL
jgi:hypothetical protein